MKLEELNFIQKRNSGYKRVFSDEPLVAVHEVKDSAGKHNFVRLYGFGSIRGNNKKIMLAVAGKRLYFRFCNDSDGYALYGANPTRNNVPNSNAVLYVKMAVIDVLKPFIDDNRLYTPIKDEECGLWYITLEKE